MLYLHETHAVIGEHEVAFEDHFRDGYIGAVATDSDARLLWYLDSTHGAGEGYKVVTITGFADYAAWDRHVSRLLDGDLAAWMREADELRYALVGALLTDAAVPQPSIDLASVPVDASERDRALFRQDTFAPLAGAELAGALEARIAAQTANPAEDALLSLEHAFVPAVSGIEADYVVTMQRILDSDRWIGSWHADLEDWPGAMGPLPGTAKRECRALRTSNWSPLA